MRATVHELSSMDRPRVPLAGWRRFARAPVLAAASGAAALAAVATLFALGPAPMSIAADSVVIDSVQRGPLVREIDAPGRLVTEETRVIAAPTRAQIERRLVEPGTVVEVGTALLILGNPDLERALLEARKELAVAEADLITTRAGLDRDLLDHEALIQQIDYQHREAVRQSAALDDLVASGVVAKLQWELARDRVAELGERQRIEQQKTVFLQESRTARLAAHEAKVDQIDGLVAFQSSQVANLHVTAPIAGVVQDIPVQEGEWTEPGDALARIIVPGRLRAELRLPQTEADEVAPDQSVSIDTRLGVVAGTVSRVEPSIKDGAVIVEVRLDEPPPKGARAQLTVKGTLRLARVEDAMHIARPPGAMPFTRSGLYRVARSGDEAERVPVAFGLASSDHIQLLEGATEGERFVVSDTTGWPAGRVELD